MPPSARYVALRNLSLLQRQAGVEPAVADLVRAYARLRLDAGEPLTFEFDPFPRASIEGGLYRQLESANSGVDPRFLRFLSSYGATFTRRGLPVILTPAHLAQHLAMPLPDLVRLSATVSRHYREIRIPKAHGGERRLLSPQGTLRRVQTWLLHRMLNRCAPHGAAHAFVRKRSIVSNARPHEGRRVVIRMDLENFFPSVHVADVRRGFERLGYTYGVARLLASLCTVEGGLPQGAPTSPALSNLVSFRLDRRFTALASRLHFSYTRYADDLVMSSDDDRLPALVPFFREVIASEGYRVNEPKTRIMRAGAAHVVTGLVTNVRTTLKRRDRRILRAMAHRLRTCGPEALEVRSKRTPNADPLQVFAGHVAFLAMADPAAAQAMRDALRSGRRSRRS
ncbi:MAG TPA: reverse transcriptase family protein [Vicinamibacterales bacterium]|jgi:retron-type reverse transcriptase|nr:reverse transcriptase family protein [Vicinamibacterales bacterium]